MEEAEMSLLSSADGWNREWAMLNDTARGFFAILLEAPTGTPTVEYRCKVKGRSGSDAVWITLPGDVSAGAVNNISSAGYEVTVSAPPGGG
jgi:hypothetical protein